MERGGGREGGTAKSAKKSAKKSHACACKKCERKNRGRM